MRDGAAARTCAAEGAQHPAAGDASTEVSHPRPHAAGVAFLMAADTPRGGAADSGPEDSPRGDADRRPSDTGEPASLTTPGAASPGAMRAACEPEALSHPVPKMRATGTAAEEQGSPSAWSRVAGEWPVPSGFRSPSGRADAEASPEGAAAAETASVAPLRQKTQLAATPDPLPAEDSREAPPTDGESGDAEWLLRGESTGSASPAAAKADAPPGGDGQAGRRAAVGSGIALGDRPAAGRIHDGGPKAKPLEHVTAKRGAGGGSGAFPEPEVQALDVPSRTVEPGESAGRSAEARNAGSGLALLVAGRAGDTPENRGQSGRSGMAAPVATGRPVTSEPDPANLAFQALLSPIDPAAPSGPSAGGVSGNDGGIPRAAAGLSAGAGALSSRPRAAHEHGPGTPAAAERDQPIDGMQTIAAARGGSAIAPGVPDPGGRNAMARVSGGAGDPGAPSAVRGTESADMAASATRPAGGAGPEIQLHLRASDARVSVRLVERAGSVQVDVRTPDHHLADALRDDLPALSARLEQAGLRAEAWSDAPAAQAAPGRRAEPTPEGGFQGPRHPSQREGGGQGSRGDQAPERRPQQKPQGTQAQREESSWHYKSTE